MTAPIPNRLISLIQEESSKVTSPGVTSLMNIIRARYGKTVQAILFYGSCMRSEQDMEGIVDLYVLVDSYRSANTNVVLALLNWLLPPNVFYIEAPHGEKVIRAKYAVISLSDFKRGTSAAWFHSYLWARFAQPVRLLYSQSERTAEKIHAALARAVITFINRALPQTPPQFNARELWRRGLTLSYRSELRSEKKDRSRHLIDTAGNYYEKITESAIIAVSHKIETDCAVDPLDYRSNISDYRRFVSTLAWLARRIQGKVLSLMRLFKALFTFKGGIDYILWKIERHSGVGIPKESRLRKYPIVGIWVMFWRLYRRGGFR